MGKGGIAGLIELLKEAKEKKGVKWDDICVRLEWSLQMTQFINSLNTPDKDLENAAISHQYQF